jgi:hypothetical protein
VPGFNIVGLTVADFDANGYLDLFTPSYIGEITRESMPSYIYWGGPEGLSRKNRTTLITNSASDAVAADYDHDGLIDLAVSCHSRDGDHHTDSKVFFNDGKRFTSPRSQSLPTLGTHFMWDQDVGNIYHRRNEQVYESSVKSWNQASGAGSLQFEADVPTRTKLSFEIRSAATPDDLLKQRWSAVTANSFSVKPIDRCLQYRATFLSNNGDVYPTLDKVTIGLD